MLRNKIADVSVFLRYCIIKSDIEQGVQTIQQEKQVFYVCSLGIFLSKLEVTLRTS